MSALEAAKSFLPFWVTHAVQCVYWPACFAVGAIFCFLSARVALGRSPSPDAPWYERARWLFPARSTLTLARPLLAIPCIALGVLFDTPWAPVHSTGLLLIGAALAYAGGGFAQAWLARLQPPVVPLLQRGRDWVIRSVLLYGHVWLTAALTLAMPAHGSVLSAGVLAVWAGVVLVGLRGDTLWLAQAVGWAHPASPEVQEHVRALAVQMGTTPPRVFVLKTRWHNAVAYLNGGKVAYSEMLDTLLLPDELRAILAHEVGHLAEPRAIRWARGAGTYLFLLPLVLSPITFSRGVAPFAGTVVGLFAVALAMRRLARRLEERADQRGLAHTPDTVSFARGLEKIYRANLYPMVVAGRAPHPNLYDRLVRAGAPPGMPPPPPPSPGRSRAGRLVMVVGISLTLAVAYLGIGLQRQLWKKEPGLTSSLALSGYTPWKLGEVARRRNQAGDRRAAIPLYQAAAELDPDAIYISDVLLLQTLDGQCPAARQTLDGLAAVRVDPDNEAFVTSVRARYHAKCAAEVDPRREE